MISTKIKNYNINEEFEDKSYVNNKSLKYKKIIIEGSKNIYNHKRINNNRINNIEYQINTKKIKENNKILPLIDNIIYSEDDKNTSNNLMSSITNSITNEDVINIQFYNSKNFNYITKFIFNSFLLFLDSFVSWEHFTENIDIFKLKYKMNNVNYDSIIKHRVNLQLNKYYNLINKYTNYNNNKAFEIDNLVLNETEKTGFSIIYKIYKWIQCAFKIYLYYYNNKKYACNNKQSSNNNNNNNNKIESFKNINKSDNSNKCDLLITQLDKINRKNLKNNNKIKLLDIDIENNNKETSILNCNTSKYSTNNIVKSKKLTFNEKFEILNKEIILINNNSNNSIDINKKNKRENIINIVKPKDLSEYIHINKNYDNNYNTNKSINYLSIQNRKNISLYALPLLNCKTFPQLRRFYKSHNDKLNIIKNSNKFNNKIHLNILKNEDARYNYLNSFSQRNKDNLVKLVESNKFKSLNTKTFTLMMQINNK